MKRPKLKNSKIATRLDDSYWIRHFCSQALAGLSFKPPEKQAKEMANIIACAKVLLAEIKRVENEKQ